MVRRKNGGIYKMLNNMPSVLNIQRSIAKRLVCSIHFLYDCLHQQPHSSPFRKHNIFDSAFFAIFGFYRRAIYKVHIIRFRTFAFCLRWNGNVFEWHMESQIVCILLLKVRAMSRTNALLHWMFIKVVRNKKLSKL